MKVVVVLVGAVVVALAMVEGSHRSKCPLLTDSSISVFKISFALCFSMAVVIAVLVAAMVGMAMVVGWWGGGGGDSIGGGCVIS